MGTPSGANAHVDEGCGRPRRVYSLLRGPNQACKPWGARGTDAHVEDRIGSQEGFLPKLLTLPERKMKYRLSVGAGARPNRGRA